MTKHLSIQKLLAAMLTITALATGQTAWAADNVTLSEDNEIPEGTAGHWYVNMGTSSYYEKVLTLTLDDLAAGQNVFKVYDDGGKNGNYTSGCASNIVINVPEGYIIQISGTVWTYYRPLMEYLTVYNGNTMSQQLADVYSPTDGEATNFGPLNTTGNAMLLYFRSLQNQTTTFQGLDLTVTVVENVLYNVYVAEGIEHGSVTPSSNSAHFNNAITLTVTPDEDHYIGTVTWNDGTDHVITPTNSGVYSFTMPQHDVTVSATFLDDVGYNWGEGNDGSQEHPYVISNRAGWDYLVLMSKTISNTDGKHFRLDTDLVNVTQALSNFWGHLDGNHHTISINMTHYGSGLINYGSGCTISNLTVEGSIDNSFPNVGSFVAQSSGINPITLTNCRSSVTITSTNNSGTDHHCGGFVGKASNVVCESCVFDGAFVSSTTYGFSGLVGHCTQLSVTDCAVVFGSATSLTNQQGGTFSFAECSLITQQGHNFYFNKGNIYYIISNSGGTQVYPLTLTEPAAAVRNGGTLIGDGSATVYADGFTLIGDEYYKKGASVIIGASGLLVTAAQYNDGTNHDATINPDGTASFTMPASSIIITATGFAAHYIDADGTEQTCDPVSLLGSSDETVNKEGGWYAVTGEVTLNQGLKFNGAAHLILTDGATLNVTGINIAVEATNLNVYGQTFGTGTLNAVSTHYSNANSSAYAIKANGSLVICGGQVNARAYARHRSVTLYGIYTEGNVNLIRGSLNASTDLTETFTGVDHNLISAAGGVLLDWRRPTDRICLTVTSRMPPHLSPVSVAQGKALWNGTEVLSGTIFNGGIIFSSDTRNFNGKTLQPCIPREVAGYGENPTHPSDKWAFIASPVTTEGGIAPTTVGGLMASTATQYDLYRFNQSATLEWQNYKAHTDGFTIENGKGYLYATKETKTLAFMGDAFNMGTEDVEVPLVYDEGAECAGWNLVGNPFVVPAYVNRPFYKMNDAGTGIEPIENYNDYTTAVAIPACTGIFVKAGSDNESVTFSTTAPSLAAPNKGCLQIALSQAPEPVEGPARNDNVYSGVGVSTSSTTLIDKAIVSFNEGSRLEKFVFNKELSKLYIPQGGKEYAIVSAGRDGACTVSTIPVNFKAEENGTYTITVNPEGVNLAYLHLIDNMTGADVDLLAANGGDAMNRANGGDARHCVSTYTFTANTTDYESRFKLVFSVDEGANGPSTGSGAFAYIHNGEIIINDADARGASLQIVDVTGRVVVSVGGHTRCVPTTGMAPGVYVLRLIRGDDVRTQKIVIG